MVEHKSLSNLIRSVHGNTFREKKIEEALEAITTFEWVRVFHVTADLLYMMAA